ncbi:MAG TPA: hypothetical protein VLU25_14085 [Acidobacteriota bacterium]|nr:hypothetical protein [Acidobacteriota bacterium]
MKTQGTRLVVHVVSCDAKIIGSLVGGCRITVRDCQTGDVLARGIHEGGSGDTESIMKQPPQRGRARFDTPGTASFCVELRIDRPTLVEVAAEGPLAFPASMQRASATTWLIPGRHMEGDGLVLQLYGFIVGIMTPTPADVYQPQAEVDLRAHVHLL